MIDQKTVLYGVVGNPVGHSLSPAMHNAAFWACGTNAVYLAFETRDLEDCIRGIRALGIRGVSVTLPHKSAVIPLLDEVDGLAKRIGAVNTVANDHGRLVGYNTDAVGALKALEEKIELPGRTCLIIGAGGAARAIGFMLRDHGVQLTISNRSHGRGKDLASALGCPFVPLKGAKGIEADLLIQTTPVGMFPHEDQCIISRRVLREGMVVMDVIYNPLETRLLKIARDRGCLTIGGFEMFIHQGAEQFRLWTGLEAPIDAMNQAVEKALKRIHEGN
ncbi:MAG: shikimate dehydrogenase [Deltaproteobacteria bacterium]|nr:MAG: shikimate dehydrogenase [Deltaproteobacteria bacterium]